MNSNPPGSSVHEIFPGKNTGMGCHSLFQGVFLTQGSNSHLLLGRQILYHWATWETQFFFFFCLSILHKWSQSHKLALFDCDYFHEWKEKVLCSNDPEKNASRNLSILRNECKREFNPYYGFKQGNFHNIFYKSLGKCFLIMKRVFS